MTDVREDAFVQIDNQMIVDGLEKNPEVRLVLEIATRARELQEREVAQEIVPSNSVAAGNAHQQFALN